MDSVREVFLDEGIDEQILIDLKQTWERKLYDTKAAENTSGSSETPAPNQSGRGRGNRSNAAATAAAAAAAAAGGDGHGASGSHIQRGPAALSSNIAHQTQLPPQATGPGHLQLQAPQLHPPNAQQTNAQSVIPGSGWQQPPIRVVLQLDGPNDSSDEDEEDEDFHDNDDDNDEDEAEAENDNAGEEEVQSVTIAYFCPTKTNFFPGTLKLRG